MAENALPNRVLMLTLANERFQQVRFYYSVPSRAFVLSRLTALLCVGQERTFRCWKWLYRAEAAASKFEPTYDHMPENVRPTILSRIRFPKAEEMKIGRNSSIDAFRQRYRLYRKNARSRNLRKRFPTTV